ncbi:antibiotic biosynthesis monooxygenase [Bacillus carboniphilus]|uniref:Antibiotic biosynthesis monooxygenase n=1 Tax=Bacillus carboniphilus TaxID=86663 RepID=A0ABY9JQC9_9BACI|nr:antibiotic biosynthesis monooxygenase [Bacillus carboniphilus]WLR41532.1 antibiotic biosynthesis monooxygenase [Bacillus carboniphilus]
MILVTNTIKVKKGHVQEVAKRFEQPKAVHQSPGFVRLEVLITKGLEEYDELKVCTTWENDEAFQAWTESDAFKNAHHKRKTEGNENKGESIMLGAELSKYEIAYQHEAG